MTKKEKRSEVFQIRFTPSEAERIFKWSVESEMDLSDYLRKVVLRGVTFRIHVNDPESIDVETINIRKVGDVGEKQRKHGAG